MLAIAAARLGWAPVRACDWEAASVEATRENAAVNGAPGIAVTRVDLRRERGPVGADGARQPRAAAVARGRLGHDAAAGADDPLRPAARGGRRGRRGVRAPRAARAGPPRTGASGPRCCSPGSLGRMAWNVVILGGGFGGLTAARRLERKLPHQSATVTLVNDANFMLYTPLLPGAAGGTLEPRHVVVPLREQLTPHRAAPGHGHSARTRTARWCTSARSAAAKRSCPTTSWSSPSGRRRARSRSPGSPSTPSASRRCPEAIALRNRLLQSWSRRRSSTTRRPSASC